MSLPHPYFITTSTVIMYGGARSLAGHRLTMGDPARLGTEVDTQSVKW